MGNLQETSFKLYHPAYEFIQEIEPVFLPLAAGSAGLIGTLVSTGLISSGLVGGLVGFGLGTVDVVAAHYGLYKTPYLTAGMLGYGTASALSGVSGGFVYLKNILGFFTGMLVSTGTLDQSLEYASAPMYGAMYGSRYAGLPGAGVGFAAGMFDEFLSAQNITHGYWLTTAMSGAAISSLIMEPLPRIVSSLPNNLNRLKISLTTLSHMLATSEFVKGSTGATLALLKQYSNYDGIRHRWFPLELRDELYDLYKDVIPEPQLRALITRFVIAMVAAQLMIQTSLLGCATHMQNMRDGMSMFKTDTKEAAWEYFKAYFPKALLFIQLYAGGFGIESFITSYFGNKLKYRMKDVLTERYYNGSILKLQYLQKPNGTDTLTLQKSVWTDLTEMTKGTDLVVKALSTSLRGLYAGTLLLSKGSTDVLILGSLYNLAIGTVTRWIATHQQHDASTMEQLKTHIGTLFEYSRTNVLVLVEENRIDDVHDQYKEMNGGLSRMEVNQVIWDNVDAAWSQAKGYMNFMIGYLLVADKLFRRTMEFDDYLKTVWMADDVYILLAYADNNAKSLISIKRSIGRLKELVPLLSESDAIQASAEVVDYGNGHVVRKIHKIGSLTQICFKEFSVKIGSTDNILTRADNVCISGPIVAVTGDSGSGKTTTLRILKGMRHFGAWGNGTIEITTPRQRMPKVVMASQGGSSTPFRTLLEDIVSKYGGKAKAYEDQVKQLIAELRVDAGSEVSVMDVLNNDTSSRSLSGGQHQKVSIIRALVSEPDAESKMFDEPFTGLDPNSRAAMRKVLRKYLPHDTMLFIVDHHFDENNVTDVDSPNGFYDSRLHFNNVTKTIEVLVPGKSNTVLDDAHFYDHSQECSGMTAVECNS